MCEPRAIYCRHPAVAVEDFGARLLALHCTDLRLVELNPTAGDLLSRLDGQTPLEQIARSMAEDYCRPPDRVLADVLEAVRSMAELGLVEQVFPEKGTA
ncbi:MAG: PqqD family protein [Chloroflexia bacterium]